ncbi:MAG TPA: arylesterase [Thermoanaerobaculia bacterium]|nr:arylesterase [Thermoanaerobaculia bacterium]
MKALPVALLLVVACREPAQEEVAPLPESSPAAEAQTSAPAEEASGPLVVFLGDSLTAGLGLAEEQAFPALIRERLVEEGISVRVVNAGVSGDTSAGGVRRLEWVLGQKPDVVVVGLGANDGLRGLSLESTEANLQDIVRRAKGAGARVVVLGMRIPPNYGPEYAAGFEGIYPRVARELGVPLVPFLLEGVGGEAELNLGDGIHPNAVGHRRVAENVLPLVREALAETAAAGAGR